MSPPRWLRALLLFLLVGTAAGGAAILGRDHPRPAARRDPPPLRLPAEVRGRPGRLVTVEADTPAAHVRWHACRGADIPDLWPSPDGKTLLFCTPTPGRYELIAWAAAGDVPTDAVGCSVFIETPEPPVPPPPEPADPFRAALRAAWDAETAPDRAAHRDRLASLYRVAGQDTVRQPQLHTAGELFAALRQAAASLVPADALPTVRAAIAAELRATLPTAPDAPLDAATRDRCAEAFARVSQALDSLR
jgi:hypothetical protein